MGIGGNCCVKRVKGFDSGQFLNEIIRKLKIVNMNFETVYKLLAGEQLPEKIDNLKTINSTDFAFICRTKFFEEDITKNEFANVHHYLFETLMKKCEIPQNKNKIYLWKVLLFLFPFLSNNTEEKLTYFFQITDFLLISYNTMGLVLNLRYSFRLHLENTLIFPAKTILEYIKENTDNFSVHPQSKQEIISFLEKCVKMNMRKFMLDKISGTFNLDASEKSKMIDIEQFKKRIADKKFIFDFFELKEYYSHLNQNLGNLRFSFRNIDLNQIEDEEYLAYDI